MGNGRSHSWGDGMVLSPSRRALWRPQAGPGFESQSLHCPVWELAGFGLCLSFPIDGALFIRSGMAGCRPRPDTLLASGAWNVRSEGQSGPACPQLRASGQSLVASTRLFTPARRNSHPPPPFQPKPSLSSGPVIPGLLRQKVLFLTSEDPQPNGCYRCSAF